MAKAKPKLTIIGHALAQNRDYITPEDVGQCIGMGMSKADVQQQVLEALSGSAGHGAEDGKLCAWIAANYKREAKAK